MKLKTNEFLFEGAESMTLPSNVVMNSLVSATKVITNDTIPNPIVAAHNAMVLPSIPVPVGCLIGIPVMSMKTDDDDDDLVKPAPNDVEKMEEKPFSDVECVEGENDKRGESMPVEEDSGLDKGDEHCCENDIDVGDNGKIAGNGNGDEKLNSAEPMECASVTSFASPKHTMNTMNNFDVVMAESVSV